MSEFLGTALLLAIITGSGFMGENLANGNTALALLANSIVTGAGLYVLITLLSPISGAHFNPVVSLMFWKMGYLETKKLLAYVGCQFAGAVIGVWLVHVMFDLTILQHATKVRAGVGLWVSEFFSTLILLLVIRIAIPFVPEGTGFASEDCGMQCKAQNVDGSLTPSRLCNAAMRPQDRSQARIFRYEGYIQHAKQNMAMLVALTVTAGYWFTSSTFFANPAVTFARSLTNTFVGISPSSVLGFVVAQIAALLLFWIYMVLEKRFQKFL